MWRCSCLSPVWPRGVSSPSSAVSPLSPRRARLTAAQQEAGSLRSEVQQLCLEIETLQAEKQRLHEAITSVESDSRAIHGIFRRHMQVR